MLKKHLKELKRITDSIPSELLETLVEEKSIAPTVKEVFLRAVNDADLPQYKRERAQRFLDAGYLDKKTNVVNPEKEKAIDEWVSQEIERAVKVGRLPDPKTNPQFHLFNKKTKKWTTKNIRKHLPQS